MSWKPIRKWPYTCNSPIPSPHRHARLRPGGSANMLDLSPPPVAASGVNEIGRRQRLLIRRNDSCPAQRVVRQLLEAAVFEGLIDCVIAENRAGENRTDHDGNKIGSSQPAPDRQDHATTFYFSVGGQSFSCQGRQRGFDRVRLYLPTLARLHIGRRVPLNKSELPDLLNLICRDLSHEPESAGALSAELMQTLRWTEWNQQHLPTVAGRHALPYRTLETVLRD